MGRLMPFVTIESRGQYKWKPSFVGPPVVKPGKVKRKYERKRRATPELSDEESAPVRYLQWASGESIRESENSDSLAHSPFSDEADFIEKERTRRNMDALLAFAEDEAPQEAPRMVDLSSKPKPTSPAEVCG